MAREGIEPPTRGFSATSQSVTANFHAYSVVFAKLAQILIERRKLSFRKT